MSYVVCRGCGAAKNPRSKLTFHETEEFGWLCGKCLGRRMKQTIPTGPQPQGNLVVVVCPACLGRGKAGAPKHQRCTSCIGFGSVRVEENALPVFSPKKEGEPADGPQLLMETDEANV